MDIFVCINLLIYYNDMLSNLYSKVSQIWESGFFLQFT